MNTTLRRLGILALSAAAVAMFAGGCAPSRSTLRNQSALEAWDTIENAERTGTRLGGILPRSWRGATADATQIRQRAERAQATEPLPNDAMEEIIDDMAEALSIRLPQIYEELGGGAWDPSNKLTIIVGEFSGPRSGNPNFTRSLEEIPLSLIENQAINEKFRLKLRSTGSGDIGGIINDGTIYDDPTGAAGGRNSAPLETFILTGNGSYQSENNGKAMSIRVRIFLVNQQTQEMKSGGTFEQTLIYHPGWEKFLTVEEDERLARN